MIAEPLEKGIAADIESGRISIKMPPKQQKQGPSNKVKDDKVLPVQCAARNRLTDQT